MEQIMQTLQGFLPADSDLYAFVKALLILIAGIILLGIAARLLFGRKSLLNRSLSSAISILFIYIITVVIHSLGVDLTFLLAPLPFITISGDHLTIYMDTNALSAQLLSMVILSVLANLSDSWLPQGKKVFSWFFYRCISVLLAMLLHLIDTSILAVVLPEGLMVWAPRILLWGLMLMILLGILKLLLAITNPLFAALYAFFFGHSLGKMIYRAVLTTAILALTVYALNQLGTHTLYIGSDALAAYIPLLAVVLLVWYIIGHLF